MSFNPRQDIGSPGFVFDKIYTSYDEMLEKCLTDEISVGRYVIILYPRQIIQATDKVYVDIEKPAGKDVKANTWWDTAIFQKHYTMVNNQPTENYKFITYLGMFNSPPPAQPAFLATNSQRDLFYLTSNEDTWIQFKDSDTTITIDGTTKTTKKPIIYHTKQTAYDGQSEANRTFKTTLTETSSGNGSYLNCPKVVVDEAGHASSNTTDQIFLQNISAIKVKSFTEA